MVGGRGRQKRNMKIPKTGKAENDSVVSPRKEPEKKEEARGDERERRRDEDFH